MQMALYCVSPKLCEYKENNHLIKKVAQIVIFLALFHSFYDSSVFFKAEFKYLLSLVSPCFAHTYWWTGLVVSNQLQSKWVQLFDLINN